MHPALYEYQTPIEFEEQCEKVEKALKDGMTDLDFLKLVSTITKTIGCGHTKSGQPIPFVGHPQSYEKVVFLKI